MPAKPAIEVFFTPEFKRNLRTLAKKYPHIRSDVQPIIEEIEQGNFVGDQVHIQSSRFVSETEISLAVKVAATA